MNAFPAIALVMFLPVVALSQGDPGKYIAKSYLNEIPPEIANPSSIRVNASDGLTLKSLKGNLVLLLFTSTG